MTGKIKIIETGDGSHSVLNLAMNETYHSRHGALQESQHVFIREGLYHWKDTYPGIRELHVFEMGMGTGLNLILTLRDALKNPDISYHYAALEAYPLEASVAAQLNYLVVLDDKPLNSLFQKIHQLEWDEVHELLPNFTLEKLQTCLEDFNSEERTYDLVYYDAFAPNKQPELWTYAVMDQLQQLMKEGAIFVTYSAKGQLKRDLRSLGLKVESLAGPPGKAEMIRATK
jgi:tRNA U34 5-methylaminomethyl-2-thiouridine-forming methyltransferase MnmC